MVRKCLWVLGIAVLLVMGGCKSDDQRKAELLAQYHLEKQRQAFALAAQRERQLHEARLAAMQHQRDLEQKQLEEEARLARVKKILAVTGWIALIAIAVAGFCWSFFVLCRLLYLRTQERERTKRFDRAVALITDGKNGLSSAQRGQFLAQIMQASGYPQLPPPPSPPGHRRPPTPPRNMPPGPGGAQQPILTLSSSNT